MISCTQWTSENILESLHAHAVKWFYIIVKLCIKWLQMQLRKNKGELGRYCMAYLYYIVSALCLFRNNLHLL